MFPASAGSAGAAGFVAAPAAAAPAGAFGPQAADPSYAAALAGLSAPAAAAPAGYGAAPAGFGGAAAAGYPAAAGAAGFPGPAAAGAGGFGGFGAAAAYAPQAPPPPPPPGSDAVNIFIDPETGGNWNRTYVVGESPPPTENDLLVKLIVTNPLAELGPVSEGLRQVVSRTAGACVGPSCCLVLLGAASVSFNVVRGRRQRAASPSPPFSFPLRRNKTQKHAHAPLPPPCLTKQCTIPSHPSYPQARGPTRSSGSTPSPRPRAATRRRGPPSSRSCSTTGGPWTSRGR